MMATFPVPPKLELWGGWECTINRVGDRFHSQLARRSMAERLGDLERMAELGMRAVRLPLLWEELAPEREEAVDWRGADALLQRVRELGLRPIVGLVHHGSGPRYTSLADPFFAVRLARYAGAVAARYPWVEAYTPVNEPLTTARFSGLYGLWYPHGRDDGTFVRLLMNQMRGVVAAMRAIREVNAGALLVQTEDLGRTLSGPALAYQAEFENERRWLSYDLLAGTLDPDGPVWSYLLWAGLPEDELLRALSQRCRPDLIGINHYVTSSRYLDENVGAYGEHEIGGNGQHRYADIAAVRAGAVSWPEPQELLREAWERYGTPLAVTEAHLACTREEQMRWLAELWRAAVALRREAVPVAAVTAWSLCGACDWESLLTRPAGHYEPGPYDVRSPGGRATATVGLLRSMGREGVCRHPLLAVPGWWRRKVRVLARGSLHPLPRRAFTPRTGRGCPMLLITGATGTLGRAFARLCHLRGLPYRLLSRAEMDICDAEAVRAAIGAFRPWGLVNAAGYVRVDEAEREAERCFRENACGPETLARACADAGVAFLTFSSDLVFDGGKAAAPYLESDGLAPLNVYGRSKAAAEGAVQRECGAGLVVRTSAFFSPWDAHNFVTRCLAEVAAGSGFRAVSDQWVSPTYVPDLVHAALDLLVDRVSGVWHLANQGAVSWAELARAAARLGGRDAGLVEECATGDLQLPARRPEWSALGSERGLLLAPWEEALERYFYDRETGDADPCVRRAQPSPAP